jgi:peroxiredoxin
LGKGKFWSDNRIGGQSAEQVQVNGVKGDEVLFLSDTKTFFSKNYGWAAGMGDRNGRWAMVFDHGKVTYAEKEKSPGEVTVSFRNLSKGEGSALILFSGLWC